MQIDHEHSLQGRSETASVTPEIHAALTADGFLEDGRVRRDMAGHTVSPATGRAHPGPSAETGLSARIGVFFRSLCWKHLARRR